MALSKGFDMFRFHDQNFQKMSFFIDLMLDLCDDLLHCNRVSGDPRGFAAGSCCVYKVMLKNKNN